MDHRELSTVAAELDRRIASYLSLSEIMIDYHRIGYRLSFPLPVGARPTSLPAGVLGSDRPYPWLIWLGWALEERWRSFALALRVGSDWGIGTDLPTVAHALAGELTALSGWDSYDADYAGAGLVTSSFAAVCVEIIRNRGSVPSKAVAAAETVGTRILDESVAPWYAEAWQGIDPGGLDPDGLHNIRCITLFRAAQLADALRHPAAATYQSQALALYRAWLVARAEPEPMTEGTAYDGFLLDSMTEWLADRPDADVLRLRGREALSAFPGIAAALMLPGRPERQAPIGDVEPQMTQWASTAVRLCRWYPEAAPAATALRSFPLERLAGWALPFADDQADPSGRAGAGIGAELLGAGLQPATATLRQGWCAADPLVVVSAARTPAGHLQTDGGTLVLGRHGRWWITDPGYQQYRLGPERDFTIGPQAHNAPVIDGRTQTTRTVVPRLLTDPVPGIELDLTGCYSDLPASARVLRTVQLQGRGCLVVDRFRGLSGSELLTHWHADGGLAWAFVDGVARLSDGDRVLWLAAGGSSGRSTLGAGQLVRHAGTTGPLRLSAASRIDGREFASWWAFRFEDASSWDVPARQFDHLIKLGDLDG